MVPAVIFIFLAGIFYYIFNDLGRALAWAIPCSLYILAPLLVIFGPVLILRYIFRR
jgi:hypothetical protein